MVGSELISIKVENKRGSQNAGLSRSLMPPDFCKFTFVEDHQERASSSIMRSSLKLAMDFSHSNPWAFASEKFG